MYHWSVRDLLRPHTLSANCLQPFTSRSRNFDLKCSSPVLLLFSFFCQMAHLKAFIWRQLHLFLFPGFHGAQLLWGPGPQLAQNKWHNTSMAGFSALIYGGIQSLARLWWPVLVQLNSWRFVMVDSAKNANIYCSRGPHTPRNHWRADPARSIHPQGVNIQFVL